MGGRRYIPGDMVAQYLIVSLDETSATIRHTCGWQRTVARNTLRKIRANDSAGCIACRTVHGEAKRGALTQRYRRYEREKARSQRPLPRYLASFLEWRKVDDDDA